MSAPVLNKKQQRKSLSGLKKRKKVLKNVLALPENATISKSVIDNEKLLQIKNMLNRLLPQACLPKPMPKSTAQHNADSQGGTNKNEIKKKRSQLLLGVNSVSRGITSGDAIAVLFANDISPKLLINHLVVLCTLKSIHFVFIPNFRELTRDALGFPCIVLGFKKDCPHFLPVVNIIKSASENAESQCKPASEIKLTTGSNEFEKTEQNIESNCIEEKNKFVYLYRGSSKKRVFIPEGITETKRAAADGKVEEFISLGTVSEEEVENEKVIFKAMARNSVKNVKTKSRKTKDLGKTDKKSNKHNDKRFAIEYSASNVMKVESNPDREKKKFKKLKNKKGQ